MPVYPYRSTTMEGVVAAGFIEAADKKAALDRLRNTGVIPLAIDEPRTEGLKTRLRLRSRRIDLVTFTAELSALLGAGLPLDRGLNILVELSEQRETQEIIESLLKSIREGGAFSDALQKHPEVFPRIYVSMVRAGEAGGVLHIVLEKLNEFLEAAKELRDHVLSALIYPSILFITGGLSIVLLLTFVLPRFAVIFSEMGKTLPLSTQVLLAVSEFMKSYGWILPALPAAAWLFLKTFGVSEEMRYRWDVVKLKLMGDVIVKLETARFCRTLGTLLASGVPLLQALANARDVVTNRVMGAAIESVAAGAKEGKGISFPLGREKVFPQLAVSMIKVGEETGQLDQMLIRIAVTYEKSLRQAVKRFLGFLEPALILGMGLIIGFIVVSVLVAIFSIADIPV